ncbi:YgiW/YdeI family stress tolerance OB fold protein [Rahnella bonaserana]|jgi:uncharacterized protein (TIGR00156 family)|uniref:NirD/YgiW/YdeI family stress tolerance protein n=1 Tax=Rahnella bonaserana TaxID=2816248 RepID=A0ABS6LWN2_9GAMM|nr:NirD/YgiW/YdeI family stress tolerance protein [Rahnella bonaserana]MBU9856499.1 NirD/YgiW/YdeI family stress tolerance protein [Rahnella bonaserana]MCL9643924.1 NirD/YgiW/YdeI family stress tolerance protein [Rahnella victoriana]
MKRIILACILMLSGLPAYSAPGGGFEASETPPPAHKQDSGIKGSEDAKESTIKRVINNDKNTWVTLEGNIIKKTGEEHYTFRDKTGIIPIILKDDKWDGQKVTPKDLVSISGRLTKEKGQNVIQVEHIRIQ